MSYAESARIVFIDMLGTLDHLISKAQEAGKSNELLSQRLADDMFSLELQFRVAINQVLLALNQAGGQSMPLEENPYRSLSEVRERIAAVRTLIEQGDSTGWANADDKVDLTLPNGVRFLMTSEEDIRDWILPNFYFHLTMAYALMRKDGVPIGKMDFLPHMRRYLAPSGE